MTNKIKVGILGSCATRDNFNSDFNKNYKDLYEVVFYQDKISLISLMSSNIESPKIEELDGLKDWEKLHHVNEFDKTILNSLKEANPDFLILEIFGDAYFGVVKVEESYVTNNHWRFNKISHNPGINESNLRLNARNNKNAYLELFKRNAQLFFAYMSENLPDCKIILHQVRLAEEYIDEQKNIHKETSEIVKDINNCWGVLEDVIINNNNIDTINFFDSKPFGDINHQWGKFGVHYESSYYREFLGKLNGTVLASQLNKTQTLSEELSSIRHGLDTITRKVNNLL